MAERDRTAVELDSQDVTQTGEPVGEYGQVKGRSQRQIVWQRFRRHRLAMIGGVALLLLFAAAFAAPVISPYGYNEQNFAAINNPPSAQHLMGTDRIGRDTLTRVLHGGRVSLAVGVAVGVISTTVGVTVGVLAGYYGRRADAFLMGATDFMIILPLIPVLAVVGSIFNFTPLTIALVLPIFLWPIMARLARSEVLSIRNQEYVQAAKAIGVSDFRIMLRHLLPNLVGVMVVQATLTVALAILLESALSFLGFGIQPPTPSWGNMLTGARATMTQQWWLAVFPGLMIVITALCVNFLGDGLRDALDPKAME